MRGWEKVRSKDSYFRGASVNESLLWQGHSVTKATLVAYEGEIRLAEFS